MDAKYTPADITYPQDLNLLNLAREKLEGYIDCLHDSCNGKKLRKQLNYIIRDIGYIEEYLSHGKDINQSQSKEYAVILQLYEQQK
ncbi:MULTISPECIES: hypothetical protein [Clostridium]|uniref:hypothetical protein n=1 Tax=Clostridium TaxID=1485 RepID=UPI00061E40EF|nr:MULTISPECIES: hypothetical protein [Clostridium]KJZ88413.1 hypothetical protein ClosIBUN125C_CONTIG22g01384 [Clostridium sp. IBUN125C]KJZ92287.1 hypothetical protein ClosIBUN13A_CONTIG220g03438 [Clostridium sp. IBUN13A]KJZ94961.1 hypothetical protein ClosIBUN22A_CONTIG135g02675 [Clostridium sp. IBUN22A]KJZ95553.1 hypothetical protein ClosIBUN62F_CONTIG13g00574 [Clostridium sp. IBUN62F]